MGAFPQRLKREIVRPIQKQSPPTSIEDDLRPISLTFQASKLLEGFTLKLLLSQVADQLDPKQFSLPKKSTTQAVVYMLHSVLTGPESGRCFVRIFFADFKKGFDLVDHNVLIGELLKIGVHSAIHQWDSGLFPSSWTHSVQIQSSCALFVEKDKWWLTSRDQIGSTTVCNFGNNLLKNWPRSRIYVQSTRCNVV